ncbi:MAG: hypothetical protein A2066_05130 [Bacteroidetes bacterium GWB2_41_8]|nr:MAG: hypothetical protein A2066_05130 [Bacteroidetes bacterium GWB2_41_8]
MHFGTFSIDVTNLKKYFQYDETDHLYLKPQYHTMKTLFLPYIYLLLLVSAISLSACTGRTSNRNKSNPADSSAVSVEEPDDQPEVGQVNAILVSPENPRPGQIFRVMVTGGKSIRKAKVTVNGPSGEIEANGSRSGEGLPYWRIDEFSAATEGIYKITFQTKTTTENLEFSVSEKPTSSASQSVWKAKQGWNSKSEALYSAWVNALFYDADERSSWTALHEVTQNKERNFLHNHLSLGEDDPTGKIRVLMEPDCADNPYYLRAYFAWKLQLPFGYHESDRGTLGRGPKTGRWITNEVVISKTHPVLKFNAFMRMVMNGVHSGTARTAFDNENSDYYPVPLTAETLRPGVVFADPYGHTLILVRQVRQSGDSPGVLLSVDAQPDGTVGIKRFWKGNFLFNTNKEEVIGEPGFKAFRPIVLTEGKLRLLKTDEIIANTGLLPFSLQQKGMESDPFYHTMEQIINPKPLDPEMAMFDLITALHEQLVVRVTSVENGEKYMKAHPGTVIPMPGRHAGVFQAGGLWEDFSTPNRDLRLLIAMDAVLDFPNKIVRSPDDYKLPMLQSPEKAKENLELILEKKLSELTITYIRSNGSEQKLTLSEILKRRDAFEMAYNPNDGAEIRWGAPENSEERSTCRRKVPAGQLEKMQSVRVWFQKRLHPPT